MKKISIIILVLLLAVAFSLPIFASAATSPGIKPGSFFYFLDTSFEKIGLFFAFNPEKKARKALQYADERLAEAEAVAENADAVQTAITNYKTSIAFVEEKSKEVEKEKVEALLISIADNTSKHQEVLADVLTKVPDEAKEAITKAIEASKRGHDDAMREIAELKGEVEKLKNEVAELKAKDEEKEKMIEELSKRKTETSSTQTKPSASQTIKTAKTPKPETLPPKTSVNTTSIVTLPSGAVVEMDGDGKIIRYIKEVSANTATPASTIPITSLPATLQIQQIETLEITSVSVAPDRVSARIEWQTNKPTSAKVFISGGRLSFKAYNSESGLSTRHIVNILGLDRGTTYSYEIESITGEQVSKKVGVFSTAPQFAFTNGPNPIVKLIPLPTGGNYQLSEVQWTSNDASASFVHNLCTPKLSYPDNISPKSVSVVDRTNYNCTFKIQDGFGNFVEKGYSFVVGPGHISVSNMDVLSGLSSGENVIFYRIRLANHDNWLYSTSTAINSLTLKLEKSATPNFFITSIVTALYKTSVPWPYDFDMPSPPTQLFSPIPISDFEGEKTIVINTPFSIETNVQHFIELRANISSVQPGAFLKTELVGIEVLTPNDKIINLLGAPYTIVNK
jgi:hypothetical protein